MVRYGGVTYIFRTLYKSLKLSSSPPPHTHTLYIGQKSHHGRGQGSVLRTFHVDGWWFSIGKTQNIESTCHLLPGLCVYRANHIWIKWWGDTEDDIYNSLLWAVQYLHARSTIQVYCTTHTSSLIKTTMQVIHVLVRETCLRPPSFYTHVCTQAWRDAPWDLPACTVQVSMWTISLNYSL